MTAYVHGGTTQQEVDRLEKQARFTERFTFSTLELKPGLRVLDLATGTGAMAGRLRLACPDLELVGLDLSRNQLRAAQQNHADVPVLLGSGEALPFADATFDRVHCSWLLEHVERPVAILREVRRVLRPGGFCQFIEVDNSTFGTTPTFDEVTQVMRALNAAQLKAGGDPYIGVRLGWMFQRAGFRRSEIVPTRLLGDDGNPEFRQAFIDEFAEIFEGLDEHLTGLSASLKATAAAQTRSLAAGGSLRYTATVARGHR